MLDEVVSLSKIVEKEIDELFNMFKNSPICELLINVLDKFSHMFYNRYISITDGDPIDMKFYYVTYGGKVTPVECSVSEISITYDIKYESYTKFIKYCVKFRQSGEKKPKVELCLKIGGDKEILDYLENKNFVLNISNVLRALEKPVKEYVTSLKELKGVIEDAKKVINNPSLVQIFKEFLDIYSVKDRLDLVAKSSQQDQQHQQPQT